MTISWNTLQILKASHAALLAIAAIAGASVHRRAVETVCKDSAPRIKVGSPPAGLPETA